MWRWIELKYKAGISCFIAKTLCLVVVFSFCLLGADVFAFVTSTDLNQTSWIVSNDRYSISNFSITIPIKLIMNGVVQIERQKSPFLMFRRLTVNELRLKSFFTVIDLLENGILSEFAQKNYDTLLSEHRWLFDTVISCFKVPPIK